MAPGRKHCSLVEIRSCENLSSHNKGHCNACDDIRTLLVRKTAGNESIVSACDISAPVQNSKDTATSDYHQSYSVNLP